MIEYYDNLIAECAEILNAAPVFRKVVKALGYERVGLQILRDDKSIVQYTSFNENGRITKIEKGLVNPDFVTKIKEDAL